MKKVIPTPANTLQTINDITIVESIAFCERMKLSLNGVFDETIRGLQEGGDPLPLSQLLHQITSRVSLAISREAATSQSIARGDVLPELDPSPLESLNEIQESINDILVSSAAVGDKGEEAEVKQLVVSIRRSISSMAPSPITTINNNVESLLLSQELSTSDAKDKEKVPGTSSIIDKHGRRSTKVISSTAILEAVNDVAEEGDGETYIRLLRPVMEPLEINTRKNVAALLLGDKYGAIIVDSLVYKNRTVGGFLYLNLVIGY